MHQLAENPSVQDKLRTEVTERFGALVDGATPTWEEVVSLEYLDAVVQESTGVSRRSLRRCLEVLPLTTSCHLASVSLSLF